MALTPFTLTVPQHDLDDLVRRLTSTRWPPALPGDSWDTGVPVSYLQRLVGVWRDDYDWRTTENRLNTYPQFVADIDGTDIHFIHVRSPHPGATPLFLTHGWPGSVLEFLDIIEPLTDPENPSDAFDVIIPSLPGFGLSGPTTEPWPTERTAAAWIAIADLLGYERFAVQGGDIGASVSPSVARLAPDRVIGVHVNGTPTFVSPDEIDGSTLESLTDLERDRVARVKAFMRDDYGYIAIQSTRPQTLAYGLSDSPAAQLAWMVDKFRAWTWPKDRDPEDILGAHRLLDNATLYWLTRTGGTSAYTGYANQMWGGDMQPSGVPTAAVQFAHDVGIRRWVEREHTVTRWTDIDRGGHFAAMEEPHRLVEDIRAFFGSLR